MFYSYMLYAFIYFNIAELMLMKFDYVINFVVVYTTVAVYTLT